jgi:hypothetical protein
MKPTATQLANKYLHFMGPDSSLPYSWKLATKSLSYHRWKQSINSHPTLFSSILILSTHSCLSNPGSQSFSTIAQHTFLHSYACYMSHLSHPPLFDYPKNIQWGTGEISTRWFKYDRGQFVCKQAARRSSSATLREWSHKLYHPSCSG